MMPATESIPSVVATAWNAPATGDSSTRGDTAASRAATGSDRAGGNL